MKQRLGVGCTHSAHCAPWRWGRGFPLLKPAWVCGTRLHFSAEMNTSRLSLWGFHGLIGRVTLESSPDRHPLPAASPFEQG